MQKIYSFKSKSYTVITKAKTRPKKIISRDSISINLIRSSRSESELSINPINDTHLPLEMVSY